MALFTEFSRATQSGPIRNLGSAERFRTLGQKFILECITIDVTIYGQRTPGFAVIKIVRLFSKTFFMDSNYEIRNIEIGKW